MSSREIQMIGNAALCELPGKVAFLSSRRVAPAAVMRCYDWATEMCDSGRCVVGGFQSALEKDVFRFLLRGNGPVIMVLARTIWSKVPEELRGPVDEGRLLIISPVSALRASATSAMFRNRWILENCDEVVLGSLDPNGGLAKLIARCSTSRITRLYEGCIRSDE